MNQTESVQYLNKIQDVSVMQTSPTNISSVRQSVIVSQELKEDTKKANKKKEKKRQNKNIKEFNMLYQISPNFVMQQTLKNQEIQKAIDFEKSPKIINKSNKLKHKPLAQTLNTSSEDGFTQIEIEQHKQLNQTLQNFNSVIMQSGQLQSVNETPSPTNFMSSSIDVSRKTN